MGERGAGSTARGAEGSAMTELLHGRSAQLDRALGDLLRQSPEVEAASVVSFDGLPMASALPPGMDENRVAAMSAALLSLGERAAEGLGRGELSQVYVEGESGTVFLISAEDEAVLVAVGARGAKVGLLLYEIRRAAAAVAAALRAEDAAYDLPPARVEDVVEEPVRDQVVEAVAAEPEPQAVATEPEAEAHDSDPLGLGDIVVEAIASYDEQAPVEETVSESVESDESVQSNESEVSTDEREYASAGATSQPTPDLGAWATFTPGGRSSPEDTWT